MTLTPPVVPLLTQDNYSKGFLIDEELMGGVSKDPNHENRYSAFVLRHTSGEYLGYQNFGSLEEALSAINQVQRNWKFEKVGGCGNGNCEGGKCKGCRIKPKAPQNSESCCAP